MGFVTLECRNLIKSFDGLKALDGVSLSFAKGKVTALIGPNGAGKTTLFHLITGFLRPDSGEIWHCSETITNLHPWQIARRGVGRLFQDVRIFGRLSVLDNLLVAFQDQRGENPCWVLLGRPWIRQQEQEHTREAVRWLKWLGLGQMEHSRAEELSWGQQKLLSLGRLMAAGADVLLLDEPTSGVNPEMVRSLLRLIRRLAEEGKTIVIIEHNMNVVMEIADWVFFIDSGQITAFGLPEEVLGDKTVRAAYLGV